MHEEKHLLQGHHQHHQCQYLSEIKENELKLRGLRVRRQRRGRGGGGGGGGSGGGGEEEEEAAAAAAAAAAWVGVYSRRGSARRSVRLICATLIFLKDFF